MINFKKNERLRIEWFFKVTQDKTKRKKVRLKSQKYYNTYSVMATV